MELTWDSPFLAKAQAETVSNAWPQAAVAYEAHRIAMKCPDIVVYLRQKTTTSRHCTDGGLIAGETGNICGRLNLIGMEGPRKARSHRGQTDRFLARA
ncbi:MAG: hypothetical protein AB3N11_14470 [Arenibacterium sp.]